MLLYGPGAHAQRARRQVPGAGAGLLHVWRPLRGVNGLYGWSLPPHDCRNAHNVFTVAWPYQCQEVFVIGMGKYLALQC